MAFLDNLENSWDGGFEFESNPISEKDSIGREKFWEDLGRPEDNDGIPSKKVTNVIKEMLEDPEHNKLMERLKYMEENGI